MCLSRSHKILLFVENELMITLHGVPCGDNGSSRWKWSSAWQWFNTTSQQVVTLLLMNKMHEGAYLVRHSRCLTIVLSHITTTAVLQIFSALHTQECFTNCSVPLNLCIYDRLKHMCISSYGIGKFLLQEILFLNFLVFNFCHLAKCMHTNVH